MNMKQYANAFIYNKKQWNTIVVQHSRHHFFATATIFTTTAILFMIFC